MGVLRNRIGAAEDKFFATVFLSSGLLFVASLFAATVAAGAMVETSGAGSIQPAGIHAFARHVTYEFLNVFGIKMAGVFTFSTCTIALRTGIFPRWIAYSGFACGVVLLAVISNWLWIALLFPLWMLLVSAQILLIERGRRAEPPPTARGDSGPHQRVNPRELAIQISILRPKIG
jgi:hypothetical protein